MHRVKWIMLTALIGLMGCQKPPPPALEVFSRTQVAMGDVAITIRISALPSRADAAYSAMGEAFALARRIESGVSEFKPTSELSRLNRAPVDSWIPIGADLSHLLRRSREIALLTEGRFDITYATPAVSYRDIELTADGQRARWRHTTGLIGLSGIAKGYIVDRMAEHLLSLDWDDFLINAGGDIRTSGTSPDGPWPITLLQGPEGHLGHPCLITLQNQSIATSGLYARGAHIIDPRNGRPVDEKWISISVVAPDTETADALATAAYASQLNARDALTRWLQKKNDLSAILVDREGRLTTIGSDAATLEITCQPLKSSSKNKILSYEKFHAPRLFDRQRK